MLSSSNCWYFSTASNIVFIKRRREKMSFMIEGGKLNIKEFLVWHERDNMYRNCFVIPLWHWIHFYFFKKWEIRVYFFSLFSTWTTSHAPMRTTKGCVCMMEVGGLVGCSGPEIWTHGIIPVSYSIGIQTDWKILNHITSNSLHITLEGRHEDWWLPSKWFWK